MRVPVARLRDHRVLPAADAAESSAIARGSAASGKVLLDFRD